MIRLISFLSMLLVLLVVDATAQSNDILGTTTPEEIRGQHRVFDIYVGRYTPDSSSVEFLNNFEHPVEIKVLFGTWCHDSKREIPAFIKTMEEVGNPNLDVEFIGVSRKKTDPEGRAKNYDLQYTPTFIIFSDEKEIGRIVEESTERIEQDLVQILKSGNFQ